MRDKYYNPAKDNPAPGAYDPHPIGQPLSSVFGSSKRGPLTPNTKNPGPGAYSSTGGLLDAPFTMKGKYGSSDNLRSPGPG